MLRAIEFIGEFTSGMSFEEYESNALVRSAVERQLLILSEAARRIGTEASIVCPGPDWKNIRGLGNIIRHDYGGIIDREIWKAVTADLPPLKLALQATLLTLPQEDD